MNEDALAEVAQLRDCFATDIPLPMLREVVAVQC